MEWLKILLLTSITLGLWSTLSLCSQRTGNRQANFLFAVFVFAMLLPPINVYSQLAFGTIDWCWILATNLIWIYGPFLYAFIRCAVNKPLSNKQLLLHSLPFIAALFYRLSPWEESPYSLILPLFSHVFFYIALSIYYTSKNREEIKRQFQQRSKAQLFWFGYLILGTLFLMITDLILISLAAKGTPMPFDKWQLLVSLISFFIHGICFFSIYQPAIFFNQGMEFTRRVSRSMGTQKQRQRELTTTQYKSLSEDLRELMSSKELYLDNELTLSKLANSLEIKTHQLSELLNNHLQQSFYDYINSFRLQKSIELIHEKGSTRGVLDIAFDAGFNNKNTFYRLFKLKTGMTPGQYIKQIDKQRTTILPPLLKLPDSHHI